MPESARYRQPLTDEEATVLLAAFSRGPEYAFWRCGHRAGARTARLAVIILAAGVPADLAVFLHSF